MSRVIGLVCVVALALVWAGCGEDNSGGGETTVIKEQGGGGSAVAAKQAEQIEELQQELEEQKQDSSGSESEAQPAADEEPESEPAGTIPDVVGERLDVAKRTLKDAGYGVRVSGGGVFGVVVDSNWVVCDQNPGSNGKVDVNVDRSC